MEQALSNLLLQVRDADGTVVGHPVQDFNDAAMLAEMLPGNQTPICISNGDTVIHDQESLARLMRDVHLS